MKLKVKIKKKMMLAVHIYVEMYYIWGKSETICWKKYIGKIFVSVKLFFYFKLLKMNYTITK